MRYLAYKILFWLVSAPRTNLQDDRTESLLAGLYLNDAFRQYLSKRERSLKDYLSGGLGMAPLAKTAYVMGVGQLVEVLNLTRQAESAYMNKNREIERQKLSTHKAGIANATGSGTIISTNEGTTRTS